MKLHWNDHANHALSIQSSEVRCVMPRLIYPDCFDNLTTLSFPDLSVAIAADANVSFPLKLLSPFAKSGCNVSCFPDQYATSRHLYPLSNSLQKGIILLPIASSFTKSFCFFKYSTLNHVLRIGYTPWKQTFSSHPTTQLQPHSTLNAVGCIITGVSCSLHVCITKFCHMYISVIPLNDPVTFIPFLPLTLH